MCKPCVCYDTHYWIVRFRGVLDAAEELLTMIIFVSIMKCHNGVLISNTKSQTGCLNHFKILKGCLAFIDGNVNFHLITMGIILLVCI